MPMRIDVTTCSVRLMSLSYPYAFVHYIYIKRSLKRTVFPLFAKHNHRTDNNAGSQFNFIEFACQLIFMLQVATFTLEQNQYVNVTIGACIATSLRTIQNGCCRWVNAPYSLTYLINYFFSAHSKRVILATKIRIIPETSKYFLRKSNAY